jgi:hypothetical protein
MHRHLLSLSLGTLENSFFTAKCHKLLMPVWIFC